MLSLLSLAVFVCLSVWAAPTFDCSQVTNPNDCEKIGFCTWNSTCPNNTNYSHEVCNASCVDDPCLKIDLGTDSQCPASTCVNRNVSEHYCTPANLSTTKYQNRLCQSIGTIPISDCSLIYYVTSKCPDVVNGQYCKSYDAVGGQLCESVNSTQNENIIGKSCDCLSVEKCKYNPTCYISGSSCVTDPCYGDSEYDYLTQKCVNKMCNSQYECVPKAVSQVYINYNYTNKTANPLKTVYNNWVYNKKRNYHYTSYICIDEKRHTTLPNTCYDLSFSIFRNPTFNEQSNAARDQTQSWWNYVADSEERDGCNWWIGKTIDTTACTEQKGCSVVDVGADKICTSDVSAGSSFIRSPSFVFILIFVGVLSFLSK